MKAIIYYRKSTDRDDRQANSLEHQLANCRKIAELNNLDVIEEIWESKSAKTEWTRTWFNRLIKICRTWKINYIVIDEPKRLSRNNLDSARVIDLFDKKQVKWIYSTGRTYLADQINDIFLLQLDLSLSKMDNAHRSKDVRDKMITCMTNTGRFLWKAPFWYKNITVRKWHKEIIINEREAKIVKEIFDLRLENKAYSTIAKLIKSKYENRVNMRYTANKMNEIVVNKFYYGIFLWTWKEFIGSHKPLISKEKYDKANKIWYWVYEIKNSSEMPDLKHRQFHFKWIAKDMSWIKLACYEKKWFIYYSNQYRSTEKVSINENILFEKIWHIIKVLDFQNSSMQQTDKWIILELIKQEQSEHWTELADIKKDIKLLKSKQEKLLDMKLDEIIDEKTYLLKYNLFEGQIKDFLEQEIRLKKDNFTAKTQILLELAQSLYRSYLLANNEWKMYIIKNLMFELSVSNKKELQIAETPLFESSKLLKNRFGGTQYLDVRKYKSLLSRLDLNELKIFSKTISQMVV